MRHTKVALLVAGIVGSVATTSWAQDQRIQSIIGNVFLQDTTPGTVQAGHASLGGTFRAGQVVVSTNNAATIPVIGNSQSINTGAVGGSFSVAGQDGLALRGTATNELGTGIGVYGEARSDSGVGVKGIATKSLATTTGVFGSGGVGGRFFSNLNSSSAVVAGGPDQSYTAILAESNTNFITRPTIKATSRNASGTGMVIDAANVAAVFNGTTTNFATFTYNSSSAVSAVDLKATGTRFGLFASVRSPDGSAILAKGAGSGANVAVEALGNTTATGTKSFVIDHPLDPENRTLYHYSAEGPDPYNVYRGNAVLDARGEAWVSLPDYYGEINTDPVYQLTPVGSQVVLFVAQEIKGNRFKIGGGKAGMKASWVITARRNDAYIRHYGIAHERAKAVADQGTYLAPEAFRAEPEQGSTVRAAVTVPRNNGENHRP